MKRIIISLIVLTLVLGLIFLGYHFDGTGFGQQIVTVKQGQQYQAAKTLWDWMQLLVIPIVLALVAVWFNRIDKRNELTIASDNQQEAALQGYLDKLSELLLERHLRTLKPSDEAYHEVCNVARVRTLTMLYQLDTRRTNYMLAFLRESQLVNAGHNTTITFSRADLRMADLHETNLSETNLSEANLSQANLRGATLSDASLIGADLSGVNLNGAELDYANFNTADLSGADLRKANLRGADLSEADLSQAKIRGATLRKAKLSQTTLSGADLSEADLSCTNS